MMTLWHAELPTWIDYARDMLSMNGVAIAFGVYLLIKGTKAI